ncbi:TRAP transporter substrate-binding protein [Uliginosibacterium sediminicola]|uniref:TRAP transporter substrate-binding protein n=1 Tax=Uliginosibacterium sediminicola TaxID=2024550 RepID=A0ABU9Z2L8_9RHOO
MERRSFLKKASVGMAAGAVAAPAIAQSAPTIKWRLASSFPKSLDTIFAAAEVVAQHVKAATGGKFDIQIFAAGELVPGLGVLDAVKDGTVECCHTAGYYFIGKDPTFAFDAAIPFGLNSRQQNAWLWEGGGMELLRDFFKDYNIHNIPCGNTGTQMGGWYRKELKTLADLKGLKMRIGGLGGPVLARLGVVPQQIAAGDIYPALEKGTIDAVEWVGPYDDEKLGFNKVAKYYYYPGFWEGSAQLSLYINQKKFQELPKEYQQILEDACAYAHLEMQARYDIKNVNALRRLAAAGTQLRAFSKEVMSAANKEAFAMYDEYSAKNPKWKKIYEPWKKFRDDELLWFGVAEKSFDDFVHSTRGGKR